MLTLKEIPIMIRPRERLRQSGPQALRDSELLAILLGAGTKGRDVLKVASELLPVIDEAWPFVETEMLEEISGIGRVKAGMIVAALEFARRRIRPAGIKIRSSKDVLPLLVHWADRKQEHFVCISLNGAHEVIATRVVTIGLVNSTQVHAREVFSDPLMDRACAVVIAHNHPSGNLVPSAEDFKVTRTLKEAGEIIGIKVIDHVIFTTNGSYSFADEGKI